MVRGGGGARVVAGKTKEGNEGNSAPPCRSNLLLRLPSALHPAKHRCVCEPGAQRPSSFTSCHHAEAHASTAPSLLLYAAFPLPPPFPHTSLTTCRRRTGRLPWRL